MKKVLVGMGAAVALLGLQGAVMAEEASPEVCEKACASECGCPVAKAMEALPKLTYKVGDEATCCDQAAAKLAKDNGGAIHFVVNNQIGFTTDPKDSRSSPYPSDVALMVQSPIFHVNGDDPEAVTFATKVAAEYRQRFGKDVVVDMFCYRRYGHNEGDDPSFTQPIMYKTISKHPTTLELYTQRLINEGVTTQKEVDGWVEEFAQFLDDEFEKAKS